MRTDAACKHRHASSMLIETKVKSVRDDDDDDDDDDGDDDDGDDDSALLPSAWQERELLALGNVQIFTEPQL